MTDVFQQLPVMTDTVYIIGSAPGMDKFWSTIDDDFTRIVINRSICAGLSLERQRCVYCDSDWQYSVEWQFPAPHIWMGHDLHLMTVDWFRNLMLTSLPTVNVFHSALVQAMHDGFKTFAPIDTPNQMYSFRDTPRLNVGEKTKVVNGILRGGGTTSCSALQLAYWCHVKTVVLVGVAMDGYRYWDGRDVPRYPGATWQARKYMQRIVYALQDFGIQIYTGTPSTLDIPRWSRFVS